MRRCADWRGSSWLLSVVRYGCDGGNADTTALGEDRGMGTRRGEEKEEQQAGMGPRGARTTEGQRSRPAPGFRRGEKEERGGEKKQRSAKNQNGGTGVPS